MKKVTTLMCILLCVLFAFTSCSNEPRKATEDEARIIKSLDRMNFGKVANDNLKLDASSDSKLITSVKIDAGKVELEGGADFGDGTVSTNLIFKLTGFNVEVVDDLQKYNFSFDGKLKQKLKAGATKYSLDLNNSMVVDVNVNYNEKNYPIRIEESFSLKAGREKLYFVGNQQVTL